MLQNIKNKVNKNNRNKNGEISRVLELNIEYNTLLYKYTVANTIS